MQECPADASQGGEEYRSGDQKQLALGARAAPFQATSGARKPPALPHRPDKRPGPPRRELYQLASTAPPNVLSMKAFVSGER